MKKILKYLKGYEKQCVLGPLFKLLEATIELLIPLVVASIVDTGISSGDRGYIAEMCAEYNRRRVFIHEGLNKIGIPTLMPEGAFYIYPYIGGLGLSSEEFCERLLREEKCAIVPGTAFGECGEGYARISYAYSVKHIEEAL